jgi:NAD(P)-dependent dehydrogenase (short-subunit alcohol dehydrogenase family)
LNTIIVTGAAGAIGKSLVEVALSRGFQVIAIDTIWPRRVEAVSTLLVQVGVDLGEVPHERGAFEALVESWEKHFDKVNLVGLVNNAAVQIVKPYWDITSEEMLRIFTVNVIAPTALTAIIRKRLVSSGGAVINIGSVHESNSKAGFSAYAASKSALAAIGRGRNLEEEGALRVYTVAPGAVDTPMLREGFASHAAYRQLEGYQPLRRLAQPDEIASFVIDLVLHGSPLMSGSTVRLDGGIHGKLHDPA